MSSTMSIADKRNELSRLGFINITGLVALKKLQGLNDYDDQDEIQANKGALNAWGYSEKEDLTAAILENGEVWICDGEPDKNMKKVLRRVCPRGRGPGALVPCTDGEILDWRHILKRLRDPQSDCGGLADPAPRPYVLVVLP